MKKIARQEDFKAREITSKLIRMKSAEDLLKKQIQDPINIKMMKGVIETLKQQLRLKQFQFNQQKACSIRKGQLIKQLNLSLLYLKRENEHLKNDVRTLKEKLSRYQLQPKINQEKVSIFTDSCYVMNLKQNEKFLCKTSSNTSIKQSFMTRSRTIIQSFENPKNIKTKNKQEQDNGEQRIGKIIKQLKQNMKYLIQQNNLPTISIESISNIQFQEQLQCDQKKSKQIQKITPKNENKNKNIANNVKSSKNIEKNQLVNNINKKIQKNLIYTKKKIDSNISNYTLKEKKSTKLINNKISKKEKSQILNKQSLRSQQNKNRQNNINKTNPIF